jgi:hypothetical protein
MDQWNEPAHRRAHNGSTRTVTMVFQHARCGQLPQRQTSQKGGEG